MRANQQYDEGFDVESDEEMEVESELSEDRSLSPRPITRSRSPALRAVSRSRSRSARRRPIARRRIQNDSSEESDLDEEIEVADESY